MSDIGHNGGPPIDWRDYGGFIVEARDSRWHHIVGYGKRVNPADESRGFCFSVNEAWRDLLHECRFADGHVMNGGRKMLIQRGSLVGAVSWLGHRWNWTPKTVRGFLDRLENDGMITLTSPGSEVGKQRGKQAQIVTVCKYEQFNPLHGREGQAEGQGEGKQGASKGQAEGNNIRNNNGTMEQEDSPLPPADAGEVDRKAINRAAAKAGFARWQDVAGRCGLTVPRDTSFDTWGQKIAARMFEHAEAPKGVPQMVAVWEAALAHVERSSFLRGMTNAGFRADLKFLCQRESFAKLIDGGYGNGAHATPGKPGRSEFAAIVGDAIARGPPRPAGDCEYLPDPDREGSDR